MNQNLYNILWKITELLFGIDSRKYIKPLLALLTSMLRHHGTRGTVIAFKQMRLHITRYMCGQPLHNNTCGVGVDKSGWPKRLLFLKPLLSGGIKEKKFLLTLLTISRTLVPRKEEVLVPDYTTITDPGCSERYTIPRGVIRDFVKLYKLSATKPKFQPTDVFLSVKGSPSGKATLTAPLSILTLKYCHRYWISKLTSREGIEFFNRLWKWSSNHWWKLVCFEKDKCEGLPGQISIVEDPECKLRPIAMLDYTSQMFLRPIHDILFKQLKKIPQDRTFTQNPRHSWSQNDQSYWSLDLTAATDRFPVHLQQRLIEEIFGCTEFASAWKNLLVERKYATGINTYIQYAVGQPMGAYSSWAAFTLAHHLVVFYCHQLVLRRTSGKASRVHSGLKPFEQYIILGDDIVIKDNAVAEEYIRVMGKLGVGLSLAKTHKSLNTYEFAKRWFQEGKEITGLPMRGIVENIHNPYIVFTILFDFFKVKGNSWTWSGNLVFFLQSFYNDLMIITTKKVKRGKGTKFIFKRSYIRKSKYRWLELFHLTLNMSLNYVSTYDQIRKVLAEATVDNECYVLPGPGVVHCEMQRILGLGLGGLVSGNIMKIIGSLEKLNSKRESYSVDDPNDFLCIPVFLALKNQFDKSMALVNEMNAGLRPIHDIAADMCQLDIDAVFNKERNKIQVLYKVGVIARKGLTTIANQRELQSGANALFGQPWM